MVYGIADTYLYFSLRQDSSIDNPSLKVFVVQIGAKNVSANIVPYTVDMFERFSNPQFSRFVLQYVFPMSISYLTWLPN